MEAYLAAVRTAIQRELVYPPSARRLGLSGQVHLRFALDAEGRVAPDSVRVVGGSDDSILRQGAMATIRRVASLPPPPAGPIGIEVPVTFTLYSQR